LYEENPDVSNEEQLNPDSASKIQQHICAFIKSQLKKSSYFGFIN